MNEKQTDLEKTKKRFWLKVNKANSNGCWTWEGWINAGYGYLTDSETRKTTTAHRYSYKIHFSDPGHMCVCHTCDNPICVNPAHLFLGTHQQNMKDMTNKMRQKDAIINDSQVLELRNAYASDNTISKIKLAAKYGISLQHVYNLINHKFRN
jgi:hypothetical protein